MEFKEEESHSSSPDSGIPRHGHDISLAGTKIGTVTSGSFSPTVKKGIGMGYVPPALSAEGSHFSINVRGVDKGARGRLSAIL